MKALHKQFVSYMLLKNYICKSHKNLEEVMKDLYYTE